MGYCCFKVLGTYENEKQERIAVINTYRNPNFKEKMIALANKYNKDVFFTKAREVLLNLPNSFVIETVSEQIEPGIKSEVIRELYKNAYDSNF